MYEDFTQEKPTPYNTYGNILRYIRCISELKELGFGLCNIEVCLPGADEAKVFHDQFKLLIKGRPYTTSLYHLYPHIFNNIDSWIIHISGLEAYFSNIVHNYLLLFFISYITFQPISETEVFITDIRSSSLLDRSWTQLLSTNITQHKVLNNLNYIFSFLDSYPERGQSTDHYLRSSTTAKHKPMVALITNISRYLVAVYNNLK